MGAPFAAQLRRSPTRFTVRAGIFAPRLTWGNFAPAEFSTRDWCAYAGLNQWKGPQPIYLLACLTRLVQCPAHNVSEGAVKKHGHHSSPLPINASHATHER